MELLNDIKSFFRCKSYVVILALIAACAYGFTVTHPAIGMDDTAVSLYYEEGLGLSYVNRWSLFVINKVFRIGTFMPWLVELVSVLILMLSVTMWCVLWRKICEPIVELPLWNYVFVAGIFLSCPLIAEVYTFYLHNGVCTGYGVTAGALLCLLKSLEREITKRQRIAQIVISSALLTFAMGFYESFVIVYMMGGVMVFFLLRSLYGKKNGALRYENRILPWMCNGFFAVALGIVLRFAILGLLKAVCHLDRLESYGVLYQKFFGDLFQSEGEFTMLLKRFFMKYYVHAICYLPITVLVGTLLLIAVYSLYSGIRKRDFALPLCGAAIVLLPVLMSIVEGMATRYRSAQYVPLVGAFGVLLILIELRLRNFRKCLSAISCILMGILIYNQCADMNKWFWLDYLKYQNAREVMEQIAYDLEKEYDITKPIIFRGGYGVPYEISKYAYVSFSSTEYRWICALTDWFDPHLKEKYFAPDGRGYVFAETPAISVLQWGVTAFDGTSGQLIEFWRMHGYGSFRCETDLNKIEEAERIRTEENIAAYPKNGYIRECEEYIIVNLAR